MTQLLRAVGQVALMACPVLASAGPYDTPGSDHASAGPASRPPCVYKGVMSDAEIERCTGFPVHYSYPPAPERGASGKAAAGRYHFRR